MLIRLLTLAAALLLACASTHASAYARVSPHLSAPLIELAHESKSAHREFAADPAPASSENGRSSHCRTGENWRPPLSLASSDCNPTVYVDPTGRIQELVNGANALKDFNQYLRGLAKEQSHDWLGNSIGAGVGVGRGLVGLTEGALRTVNAGTNLGVLAIDAIDKRTNKNYRGNELADESFREIMLTGRAIGEFDKYLQDDGLFKSYDHAVETTSYALEGQNAEISDVFSALTTVSAPTRVGTLDVSAGANNALSVARSTAAKLRDQARSLTVAESPDGAAASLARRMEINSDNDFWSINQPVREPPNFYVNHRGEAVPSIGYRYMRYEGNPHAEGVIRSQEASTTYFGFEKFDTGWAARDAFQVKWDPTTKTGWSDARLRGEFDTLQLFKSNGDLKATVPLEGGGAGPGLEPITESYPQYGRGGVAQLDAQKQPIWFYKVNVLPEK